MGADGQNWRQYVIAGVGNISVVIIGYCMGWTSPVNLILGDENQSPLDKPVTTDQLSWIGSLLTFGLMIGPFLGGFATSTIGRRWGLLSSAFLFLIGWILILVATNVAFIYAGRIFWGVASGMVFVILPMYCAEISTVEARGALGSLLQSSITLGFLLVYANGPIVSYSGIAYIGIAVVAVFFAGFFFMPETPTYYLIKNNPKSAAESLAKIRGQSIESVQKELDLLIAAVDASKEKVGTIADIFKRKNLKALFIGCALMFFQQFTGVTVVVFYMQEIFSAAGSNLEPAYATVITGVVQVISLHELSRQTENETAYIIVSLALCMLSHSPTVSVCFLAALMTPFVADRLKRRTVVMFSGGGCAIGLTFLGLYFYLAEIESPIIESINFLPLVSMMVFLVMFRWGLGAIPWAIIGEIMPIEVKKSVAPLVTSFCWTCSFLVNRYYNAVAESAGHYVVFWIFAACSALCFLFGLFILPETKDKTFIEIQDMLAGKDKQTDKRLLAKP